MFREKIFSLCPKEQNKSLFFATKFPGRNGGSSLTPPSSCSKFFLPSHCLAVVLKCPRVPPPSYLRLDLLPSPFLRSMGLLACIPVGSLSHLQPVLQSASTLIFTKGLLLPCTHSRPYNKGSLLVFIFP